MNEYTITDENKIPDELKIAVLRGDRIQLHTGMGWINIDDPDFRVLNTYRVIPYGEWVVK